MNGTQLSIEHAALLHTGDVLFLESGTDTIVWDPTDEVTPQFAVTDGPTTGLTANLFCSGHAFLSNGEFLVVGGGGGGPGAASSIQGWRYDPTGNTWTRTGDMTTMRWYPTAPAIDRGKGMSALVLQPTYPFVRVVCVGGGPAGTNATAQTIDLSTLSPSWGPTTTIPDGRPRVNGSAVLLPDSTILVTGGLQSSPYPTWLYDPNATINAWRLMDENHRPRHYHSCALLLPSGKVMMAGGASPAGCSLSVENSIEVFSPPYLFKPDGSPADRPDLVSVDGQPEGSPVQVHHGQSFTIGTPHACDIAKVALIRPMAVTHQTDSEQRVVHLPFHTSDTEELTATAPDGGTPHSLAPRGYYLLFILDGDGVPSEGRFVHLH